MGRGSVMNAISRTSPQQLRHSSGNSSPTRAISLAQAIRNVSCERDLHPFQTEILSVSKPKEGIQGHAVRKNPPSRSFQMLRVSKSRWGDVRPLPMTVSA